MIKKIRTSYTLVFETEWGPNFALEAVKAVAAHRQAKKRTTRANMMMMK